LQGWREPARYVDVRACTYRNRAGLQLLGCPGYASSNRLIGRDEFVKVFSVQRKHYSVALIDCGNGLKHGVIEVVLRESRALVLVTSASTDAVRKAGITWKWLCDSEYQRLVESAVLAVNHIERANPTP
jgi:chromosome partitioning protein